MGDGVRVDGAACGAGAGVPLRPTLPYHHPRAPPGAPPPPTPPPPAIDLGGSGPFEAPPIIKTPPHYPSRRGRGTMPIRGSRARVCEFVESLS
eukprot:40412-Prorocentrum_minimum.AAC.1